MLFAVIPIAMASGLITALFIDNLAVAIPVGGVVGALIGFSIHALVKYWLLRD